MEEGELFEKLAQSFTLRAERVAHEAMAARIAELNGVAASTSQGGRHAREPGATASGSGCSTSRTSAPQNMQDDMLVDFSIYNGKKIRVITGAVPVLDDFKPYFEQVSALTVMLTPQRLMTERTQHSWRIFFIG